MEPITWGWLAATVLSGIVGGRADTEFVRACSTGWRQATRRLRAPEQAPTSNELSTAVHRAFLWAQHSLVEEYLGEWTGGTYQGSVGSYARLPGYEIEIDWLIAQRGRIKASLRQLEQGPSPPLPDADLPDLEGLIQGQAQSTRLQEQLLVALQRDQPPARYIERAVDGATGLMPRLAAYFELELKSNQSLQNWFQSELLMQINAQLQSVAAMPLTFGDLEHGLHRLAQQVPEVLNQINNLKLAVDDVGQTVNEVKQLVFLQGSELMELASQHGDDLAALKRAVGELVIALQQSTSVKAFPSFVRAQPRGGPNPFIYGPAVLPERFYGRQRAIADIKNRIGGVEPQSINIVGLRRNGKSSMLRYVKERIDEFCLPEQKPLVMLLDLQDRRFHTPLGIVEGLRRSIQKQTGATPWAKSDNDDPFELEDGLTTLRDQGYRLIVLFDEFGAIGKRLEQFQDWGDDWRSKASASLVTLVIASRRPLGEIYQTLNLTSPFGNLFSTTILGALEPEAWRQLLQQGALSVAEIQWVDSMAGQLPFYSQMAAAMAWQYGNLSQAEEAFRQQADPRWADLWRELTPTEQAGLQQTLNPTLPMLPTAVVEQLMRHGLLRQNGQICGAALAAFIGEQR